MKIRNYKRVLSMLLVVSMLIGQFMVSTAMAANETVIIDDSSDNIINRGAYGNGGTIRSHRDCCAHGFSRRTSRAH